MTSQCKLQESFSFQIAFNSLHKCDAVALNTTLLPNIIIMIMCIMIWIIILIILLLVSIEGQLISHTLLLEQMMPIVASLSLCLHVEVVF